MKERPIVFGGPRLLSILEGRRPPTIPPEYMHCKFSEIPEPYKTDIKHWIEREKNLRRFARDMCLVHFIGMAIVATFSVGIAIHFLLMR